MPNVEVWLYAVEARRGNQSKLEKLSALVGLAHPRAVLVFTSVSLFIAILAERGWPPWRMTMSLALAMALVQIAVGIFNEYYDRDLDATSKPDRAIPAGVVSAESAHRAAWISLALGLGAGAALGRPADAVLAFAAAMGILYSARLKRSALSWLPYALAYPALPIWVWLSLDKFRPGMLIVYPLAIPFAVGVHLTNQLRDYDEDSANGMRGLAHYLGKEKAGCLCMALLALSPLLPLADVLQRHATGAAILFVLVLLHWLLVAQCVYEHREAHDAAMWQTMFRRLQLSGPLILLAWVMSISI